MNRNALPRKKSKPEAGTRPCAAECGGFTLIELVAAVVMIALLGATLLPALARTSGQNQAARCINNQRQLMRGFAMYSSDNTDAIVRTGGMAQLITNPNDTRATQPNAAYNNWVYGTMDTAPSWTNTALITVALLGPYSENISTYKCPADVKKTPQGNPTVRSVSMSGWMNPIQSWNDLSGYTGSKLRDFRRYQDITSPTPANCWVVIDENPATINDGWFICDPNKLSTWVDRPAAYHNGGAGLAFADGHSEIRRWSDQGILYFPTQPIPKDPNSPDLGWLQIRTTSRF